MSSDDSVCLSDAGALRKGLPINSVGALNDGTHSNPGVPSKKGGALVIRGFSRGKNKKRMPWWECPQ